MGLDAESLHEGLAIAFHCLGRFGPVDVREAHQFLRGFQILKGSDGAPFLTGTRTELGTRWTVHETANPGVFTF
jgi:hypothetical protein